MGSKSAIGIGNGICFKQVRDKGGGSYIDPLVRDSIVGLWKFDQNTNESPTCNIIKNTIKDKGGDLELLNFAYKANSGYNGYSEDFTSWRNSKHLQVEYSTDGSKFKITSENIKDWWLIVPNSGISNSFKVKITNCHFPIVWRYTDDGNTYKDITISEDGIYNLPQSIINNEGVVNRCYFGSGTQRNDYTGLTIEQLPLYEGTLVTDGKDDMIVSQKSFIDIVGSDNQPYTIVSMVSFIDNLRTYFNSAVGTSYMTINNIDSSVKDKTGIFGYSTTNVKNTPSAINDILGDKNDYPARPETAEDLIGRNFFIQGYLRDGIPTNVSSVAVYWTFISNKVLTTDEINQIIGYYKLDKYVTPQVIYDVKRQGLTNDTPAADWYLKDFSGNGYDMQLYNYAKRKDSGIGKYAEDFTNTDWIAYPNVVVSKDKITVNSLYDEAWFVYKSQNNRIPPMKIKIVGIPANAVFIYRYCKNSSDTDATYININEDGIYDLPESVNGNTFTVGFMVQRDFDWTHIEITQIPDYEGALVSDGKDDYGKAKGLPILKDYTIASKYSRFKSTTNFLLSKAAQLNNGAFLFNDISNSYSFGISSAIDTHTLFATVLRYQSKYINQGKSITAGPGIDSDLLWLNIIRDNDNKLFAGAFYSMLLFPYSLSEFLLERQLKKYKLGTLYPDMVEFRPIVSGNIPYDKIEISQGSTVLYTGVIDKTGIYLQEGSTVRVYIKPSGTDEVSKITINGIEYTDLPINVNGYYYADFPITKSPQEISYVIDEHIRFEDIV